jgi:ABC-2 type transport system permease protein
VSAYLACFRAALQNELAYRAAALAGIATQFFWGLLRIAVFSAFYAASTGPVPLSLQQVIDYVWLGQAFLALLPTRVDPAVAAAVRSGTIAYELVRPVDLHGYWFARAISLKLGPALLRAPPLMICALWLMPESIALRAPESTLALAVFALSITLALLVSACLTVLLDIFTLRALDGEGATMLVFVGSWVLSGMVPVPLLPAGIATLIEWLPFAAMADLPFRTYVGQIAPESALPVLLRQLGWVVVLWFAGRSLLAGALRRVVVQGG